MKDKKELFVLIEETMKAELLEILRSAQAAHGGATHEDAIAKSKYDTHGLELSYLAGSQFERARLLEKDIAAFRSFYKNLDLNQDFVDHGSLVELEKQESGVKTSRILFISPYGAGRKVEWYGKEVLVLSPDSRLGMELIDQQVGDEVTILPNEKNYWLIKSTY
ncbi:MAG: transcription elongation factor GreAB [Oligoflexus sp.]